MSSIESTKDGLKKLYLIKSAGYEFAEIDLGQNTLLLGESGVGKTTLMRAVLFFYTMDYSDSALNINPDTKKSFNQWYFKEHNSHIVYEYTKDGSRFLFIVSRSMKLHYTFVDITNSSLGVKELLIDENKPLNLERLIENIQTNNLPSYDTSKKEKYINIFHKKDADSKKIKHDSSLDFSLFESINSRKEFAKTLSNIFASSKVSSNSLKKSIVSLIDDSDAKINLGEIKISLNKFISERKEIEKFEKKIPTIEKLSQIHNSYKENKKEFKTKANIVEKLKQDSSIKIEESKTKLQEIESKQQNLKIGFEVKQQNLSDKISDKDGKISIESAHLEKLTKKAIEYKESGIDGLVVEYNNEQTYTNSLTNAKQRFEILTSDAKNIEDRYIKIKEKLHKDSNDEILNIKTKNQENIAEINSKINLTIQTKEQKIEESSKKYVEDKKELETELENHKNSFNNTKISLAKAEHFPFNKEQIENLQKDKKEFEEVLFKTKAELLENSHNIKKVEQELKDIELNLKDSTKKLDEKILKAKDLLFEQKLEIEKKLDFEGENLYGFLNKNSIKNRERIVTYLKDEILFSQKKFSVKQVAQDSSIFGLEIEFDDEFQNNYNQAKLLEQLKNIKEKVKELNKKAQTEKKNLESEAQRETKEKNRQRGVFYALESKLTENEKSYVKNIESITENIRDMEDDAKKQRETEITKFQKLYASQELLIGNLRDKILDITNKIQNITNTITNQTKKITSEFQEQIKESELTQKTKILSVKESYKVESKRIENEMLEALKDEGIDDKLLKEIQTEIQNFTTKLENISKYRAYVTVYLSEYKDEIESIPQKTENLKGLKTLRDEYKDELKSVKSKYKVENQQLKDEQEKVNQSLANFENFLKQYSEKIDDENIQKSIKRSVTLAEILLPNDVDIKSVIGELIALYERIKNNEEKIKSSVLEVLNILNYDNIFKIEIERDYINSHAYLKTAKGLISYIQNDKLTLFKNISSDGFKSSLNFIRKELSIFEDAILDVESEVMNLRNTINKAVDSFVVIDSIKIRFEDSNNEILNSLKTLSDFYDNNNDKFLSGLFNSDEDSTQKIKDEFTNKISKLVELLKTSKEYVELDDGFVLEFKVTEKGNDLKWRQTLNDIGSNGTSTLVKSIINISMLQMVSKNIVKNNQFLSHCILDEIGTISTDYFRELKDFVNRSGFVFLNGMPIEDDMLISMYPTIYVGQNQGNYSRMILASKMDI